MTDIKWDFREGLLLQKVIYKDESCKFGEGIFFFGVIFLTWIWGLAWFSLFFWMYIYHRTVSFWIFIAVFLIHFILLFFIGTYNILYSKHKKKQKLLKKEENEILINQIEKSKKYQQHKNIINNSENNEEIINTETKMLKNE